MYSIISKVTLPQTGGFITNTFLKNFIDAVAPIVAIFLVFFLVYMSIQAFRGNKDWKGVAGGAIFFFVLLGLMYTAGSFKTYGKLFQVFVDNALNKVGENANNLLD